MMNKLFGLFLLAIAFLAPNAAYAVNCFWVGGTGTWDAASITNWAPTTGAAATGCQTSNAAPAAGDNITFDSSSGGGTATPTTGINGIAFGSLSAGGYTNGTLAFNTNNPSPSFTTTSFSGSVTRTINMGSGTWTITSTSTPNCFDVSTVTGLTATFSNAAIVFSANATIRQANFGTSLSYGAISVAANSSKGSIAFGATTGVTFASLTVASGNTIGFPQGLTTTITGALSITGTSSAPSGAISTSLTNNATVSVGSASTIDWAGILGITKAGAGSITATNSLDMGRNTSVTITAPSVGGGGGRIIGG